MKTIVVVGLGPSAFRAEAQGLLRRFETIGVNDVDLFHHPKHLLLLDEMKRFTDERKKIIKRTQAKYIYYVQDRWDSYFGGSKRVRKFQTAFWNFQQPPSLDESGILIGGKTSPFVATHLAYQLGAIQIGLIGVDITKTHGLSSIVKVIDRDFQVLYRLLQKRGVELYNCSSISRLKNLPYKSLKEL